MENIYAGSYVIVGGQRIDDLSRIKPDIEKALSHASEIEGHINESSVVERNPKNRAVVKVVKVLEISYADITPFVKAFKQEAENGDFTERKNGNTLIMTLASRGTTQNRIYMLKADNYYREHGGHNTHTKCNVTIIVKHK